MTLHHEMRSTVRLKELSVQLQFLHAAAQIRFILLTLRELLHGNQITILQILHEPYDGAASLTENFEFLVSVWLPVIRTIHFDVLLGQVLHNRPLQVKFVFG